jgi:flavin reductase (DIM6/NTAB) family NADH-FMN oxidoreductase RutF
MSAVHEAAVEQTAFNAQEFRSALGSFATGVTVITTSDGSEHYGMTANSFSSVSLDPPLVLVCAIAGTEGQAVIEKNRCFAVNILAHDQEPISRYFASKNRPRGEHAFRDVDHRLGVTGSPILDGVVAHLDCTLHADHLAGDHVIFIGEVQALEVNAEAEPLLFFGGKYRMVK